MTKEILEELKDINCWTKLILYVACLLCIMLFVLMITIFAVPVFAGDRSGLSDGLSNIMIYNDYRKRQAADDLSNSLHDFSNTLRRIRQDRELEQRRQKTGANTGFLKNSYTSGMNTICVYESARGEVAITIDATLLCPVMINN